MYSLLDVIKHTFVKDCFVICVGMSLLLECDIGAQYGTHTLSSHKFRTDIHCAIHTVPVLRHLTFFIKLVPVYKKVSWWQVPAINCDILLQFNGPVVYSESLGWFGNSTSF